MHNQVYSEAALKAMYMHGRGILSPQRYSGKKMSYYWTGFGIGTLGSAALMALLHISLGGWYVYAALFFSGVCGGVGIAVMGSVFKANFVCDNNLSDPLFLPPHW